jgi:spore coat polysaccharide biosynthesis predicted glycosyltransferase SpsG
VNTSTNPNEIGIVVDAGPVLGYGHAVRCIRLARALSTQNRVVFYPLSEPCKAFIESYGFSIEASLEAFPPVVITDLREAHGITAAIHRNGSRHVSIHDLGLAQCHSDVVIDGSITRLFPYRFHKDRDLFLGPDYMITGERAPRSKPGNSVLVTFGGGSTARFAESVAELLSGLGLTSIQTRGFGVSTPMSDAEITEARATCRFAISGSGVTLYDLLASGVPTIAIAFDRLQLRTADSFHELGAVVSMGLMEHLSPSSLLRRCTEMVESRALVDRLTQAGQLLVDGKGLSRVIEIVRRQLWLTSQQKTFTAC